MWSHDERKHISPVEFECSMKTCPHCGRINKKYVESHYTGGQPCALLAKYCTRCGGELERRK